MIATKISLACAFVGLVIGAESRAQERPKIVSFACKIAGARTQVLVPRHIEETRRDDDLECWAILDGLPRKGRVPLAGELRILAPRGGVRTVATGMFEGSADRPGRAWIDKLFVPHSTWTSGVHWRTDWRPVLKLSLHVYSKGPSAKRKRWRPLLKGQLDIDHVPRSRRS